MSDRVAILNHGKLVQEGPPALLYERPRTRFVADFLGKSNFLHAEVREIAADRLVLAAGRSRLLQAIDPASPRPAHNRPVLLSLRPEKIALLREGEEADNAVEGRIASWSYLGAGYALAVETPDLGTLRVTLPSWGAPIAPAEGLPIRLGWNAAASVAVEEDL